jgi:hypothetical protein
MSKLTIALSERRPVTIDTETWSKIAEAETFHGGNGIACQANSEAYIRVRQHEDGRRVVYGAHQRGPGGMPLGWNSSFGGFLVEPKDGGPDEAETVRAIRRVAGILDEDDLANECIAELPPEEL